MLGAQDQNHRFPEDVLLLSGWERGLKREYSHFGPTDMIDNKVHARRESSFKESPNVERGRKECRT